MRKTALFIALFLILTSISFAQEPFEGKVSFTLSAEGELAERIGEYLPSGYAYTISEDKILYQTLGGPMMTSFLMDGEQGEVYMIDYGDKTAYTYPEVEAKAEKENVPQPIISKMDEAENILGYHCEKYKIETVEVNTGHPSTQYLWVTEKIHLENPIQGSDKMGSAMVPGIEGFPLKIVFELPGVEVTLLAEKVDQRKVDPSEVAIPEGFQIKEVTLPQDMGR